ncbi:Uncharacterised protein [Staphylococcus aureus]|nr:Uncharacterised protein [Staphylococcus aureus]CAC7216632.1 Uncharacterised protein [Staphylococcus aureus]CAC7231227.1 Uncharacterised protein [Staphylococcus aureus]CAC8123283.1 Uncharacterised protein [Staphylococcus aureus]CAC8411517.1 Uncharacterised protein [Staphylococcus aureus]
MKLSLDINSDFEVTTLAERKLATIVAKNLS